MDGCGMGTCSYMYGSCFFSLHNIHNNYVIFFHSNTMITLLSSLPQVGLILTGFIKKAMPYGCFVEFPHHMSGLAPTKYLSDEFLSNAAGLYQEMQSVRAKVGYKQKHHVTVT